MSSKKKMFNFVPFLFFLSGNIVGFRITQSCHSRSCSLSATYRVKAPFSWNYRRNAISVRQRLITIAPPPFFSSISSLSGPLANNSILLPLKLDVDTRMRWNVIPSAEIELKDGIVSEEKDWLIVEDISRRHLNPVIKTLEQERIVREFNNLRPVRPSSRNVAQIVSLM